MENLSSVIIFESFFTKNMNKYQFSSSKSVALSIFSGALMTFTATSTLANDFTPFPLYDEASKYEVDIPTTGSLTGFDETNIYFPVTNETTETFPVVLMLQGALVDQEDYDNFASIVSRYGYTVVVPNHERTVFAPTGSLTGLLSDQELVNDVLDFMVTENVNPVSPIQGLVDTEKMGLLGHSFGGAVGLNSIQNVCAPVLCNGSFERPEELMAGIFYGTNWIDQTTGEFLPIDNQGIPTGLIAGDRDGVATLDEVEGTFEQIQDHPKVLVTVLGANHYGITNEDNVIRDPIRPTIPQEEATETIARWSALFLRAHIQEDAGAFDYVYNGGALLDPNVVVRSVPIPEPAFGLTSVVVVSVLLPFRLKKNKVD